MKHWTKSERASATISFVLNYKPERMKEVVTAPITVKISALTDNEFKVILSLFESDRSYKSRKLTTQLNKETNGKEKERTKKGVSRNH